MEPAGATTATEIAQQPSVLARLLHEGAPVIREVAARVAARAPRFVLLAARGTSDNAALYAKYLLEVRLGLPVGLVSPSTTTLYRSRQDLRDVLVVALSQSGGSPDLVEVLDAARKGGAATLAITNSPASALAMASELHLDVLAGPERAVPATKSYTAQLLTSWLLVDHWGGGSTVSADALPEQAAEVLARDAEIQTMADRYRFAAQLVVTGRGYASATAREAALKIMETSFLSAHAWSSADLLHGPLAMVDEKTSCIAVVPEGPGGQAMRPVLSALLDRHADVAVVGDALQTSPRTHFGLPSGVAEELSPILQVLPFQLLAHRIAVARGYDPDAPRALAKVTKTL
jgi:glucosamine--fructose-6-phosphate aminotransferase (isomerizing)